MYMYSHVSTVVVARGKEKGGEVMVVGLLGRAMKAPTRRKVAIKSTKRKPRPMRWMDEGKEAGVDPIISRVARKREALCFADI